MSTSMLPGPKGSYYPVNVSQREFPPNEWNLCLDDEADLWRLIQRCGGLSAICPGHKYPDPPWVKMPGQGKRYGHPSSIPLASAVLDTDTHGRPLASWPQGPTTLSVGEVWAMSTQRPNSWDSRYYGPISFDAVLSTAVPLWVMP